MNFPGRPFQSNKSPAIQSEHAGDPSQPETSGGPVQGAEAPEDELDVLTADVSDAIEPPQDDNREQAVPPGSSEQGEASNTSTDRMEYEAADNTSDSASPQLSQAHADYHSKPEDELVTETQGTPEDQAESTRVAAPAPLSVQDRVSEAVEDIFQKKVVGDPLVKALLEIHSGVDLRKLAVELGEFATNIGARKHRN